MHGVQKCVREPAGMVGAAPRGGAAVQRRFQQVLCRVKGPPGKGHGVATMQQLNGYRKDLGRNEPADRLASAPLSLPKTV